MKNSFSRSDYLDSNSVLKNIINRELEKNKFLDDEELISIRRLKDMWTVIGSIINFILVILIFLHISDLFIILLGINILLFYIINRHITTTGYLIRKLKKNPDSDISELIKSVSSKKCFKKNSFLFKVVLLILSLCLPLLLFINPRVIYTNNNDGVTISYYIEGIKSNSNLVIPSKYKGKSVTCIGKRAFYGIKSIKSIKLADSIKLIDSYAFSNTTNLSDINVPKELEYIGNSAFEGSGITSFTMGKSVTSMGKNVFKDCVKLTSISLSENIKNINTGSFSGCSSLEFINLVNITNIYENSFSNCTKLSSVSVSKELKYIDKFAFRNCSSLMVIKLFSGTNINEDAFRDSNTVIATYGNK